MKNLIKIEKKMKNLQINFKKLENLKGTAIIKIIGTIFFVYCLINFLLILAKNPNINFNL